MTSLLGVEVDCPFSPGLLRKVAYTGAQSCSFPKVTKDLEALAEAFVTDGAASNWSVHREHFSHYTPILDFTHAVCYIYAQP